MRILVNVNLSLLATSFATRTAQSLPHVQPIQPHSPARDSPRSSERYQLPRGADAVLERPLPQPQAPPRPDTATTATSHATNIDHGLIAKRRQQRSKSSLADLMVFVGGVANVVSFQKFGFYASMMTGNTIRCCTALADARLADAVFHASTLLSYTAGAALFRFLTLQHERREAARRRPRFSWLSLAALGVFAASDLLGRVLPVPERWIGCFMALGFGFVNAISADETAVITWAATGHVNKLGMAAVDALMLGGDKKTRGTTSTNLRVIGIFSSAVFLMAAAGKLALLQRLRRLPVGTMFGIAYAAILSWYSGQLARSTRIARGEPERDTWEALLFWSPFTKSEHTHEVHRLEQQQPHAA